ncbi:MAG: glycoside hydrolase family 88 protein [Caldilineaceae bacterium]
MRCAPSRRQRLWRQVINNMPDSYLEMSVTCIVGYALARGMRLGWLDATYHDALMRAWRGVNGRIDDEGGLVGVCVGMRRAAGACSHFWSTGHLWH